MLPSYLTVCSATRASKTRSSLFDIEISCLNFNLYYMKFSYF